MKYVGQVIFSGEAEDLDEARSQAESMASNFEGSTVVHVSDSLGGQFNPVHLLDAQSAFGHIAPEPPAETEPESEVMEIGEGDVAEVSIEE